MARTKQTLEAKFEVALLDLSDAIHVYYMTSTTSKRQKLPKWLSQRMEDNTILMYDVKLGEIVKLLDKLEKLSTELKNSDDANLKKFGRTGMKRVEKQVDSLVYHYHRMNELLTKSK